MLEVVSLPVYVQGSAGLQEQLNDKYMEWEVAAHPGDCFWKWMQEKHPTFQEEYMVQCLNSDFQVIELSQIVQQKCLPYQKTSLHDKSEYFMNMDKNPSFNWLSAQDLAELKQYGARLNHEIKNVQKAIKYSLPSKEDDDEQDNETPHL